MFREVCRGAMVMHSRESSVIKFCIASQLLFARGPAGSFAFEILGYARAPRSLRQPFLLFSVSRGNKRLLRDSPRRDSRGGKISSTGERAEAPKAVPLSSRDLSLVDFVNSRRVGRRFARSRSDITGQKVPMAKSSRRQFKISRYVNAPVVTRCHVD